MNRRGDRSRPAGDRIQQLGRPLWLFDDKALALQAGAIVLSMSSNTSAVVGGVATDRNVGLEKRVVLVTLINAKIDAGTVGTAGTTSQAGFQGGVDIPGNQHMRIARPGPGGAC